MTSFKFGYKAEAQALYEVAQDSADESLGNCDYGWMALFLVYDEWTIPAAEWSGDDDMTFPAGSFMTLTEDTSGSVWVSWHPVDTLAQEHYDGFAHYFAIWEEANGY